jgi:hypothetical protein
MHSRTQTLHCTALHFTAAAGADRSFVTFILEPLYKLTSAVVGEHPKTIERLLGDEFGIHLKSSAYSQDVKPLLKEVRFKESCTCILQVRCPEMQFVKVCITVASGF